MNMQSSRPTAMRTLVSLSAAVLLSSCASSQTNWENHQLAVKQQLDQHLYDLYKSDCKKGLVDLSWIEKRGDLTEKAYQQCLTQFRGDMNEESFHTAVVQQLQASNLWFESAVWLQQKGLFAPLAKQQCKGQVKTDTHTFLSRIPNKTFSSNSTQTIQANNVVAKLSLPP